MPDPVCESVEVKDLETLIARAEDLIAEVEAANPRDHPVTVRRRKRDLESARWLLSAIPALCVKYGVDP